MNNGQKDNFVDSFNYKGREFNVIKDKEGNLCFSYLEDGRKIVLEVEKIKEFINSPFSHTVIADETVDMIEKSIKINNLIYDLRDLKTRLKKYI